MICLFLFHVKVQNVLFIFVSNSGSRAALVSYISPCPDSSFCVSEDTSLCPEHIPLAGVSLLIFFFQADKSHKEGFANFTDRNILVYVHIDVHKEVINND